MKNKRKGHRHPRKDSTCPCCERADKGPVQYALLKLQKNRYVLLEADEIGLLDHWVRNTPTKPSCEEPTFPIVEPPDGNPLVLTYGVLRPQANSPITDWTEELRHHQGYGHATIVDGKIYCSCYEDFILYPQHAISPNHIPCALLLDTPLNLNKRRDYGFGYNTYLKYGNMGALTNILNRPYVFCLRSTEPCFDPADKANWTQYIDIDKLLNTASELW